MNKLKEERMKRKTILTVLFTVLITACMFLLASCGFFGGGSGSGGSGTGGGGAQTKKTALTKNMVACSALTSEDPLIYSGEPVTISESDIRIVSDGVLIENKYFTFVHKNNDKVGTASLTITATSDNPKVKGSVTFYFEISAAPALAADYDQLVDKLSDESVTEIAIESAVVIEEGSEPVIVPENKVLRITHGGALDVKGKLTNKGTIIIGNAFGSIGKIYIDGEFYNDSVMEVKNTGVFVNGGKFHCEGKMTFGDESKFVTNFDIGREYSVPERNYYLREPIRASILKTRYPHNAVAYEDGIASFTPEIYGEEVVVEKIEYFDNTKPGRAKAIVTIGRDDLNYYGQTEFFFEILKGKAKLDENVDWEALKAKIESGYYCDYAVNAQIEVPEGETLTIKKEEVFDFTSALTIKGGLINRGTLSTQGLTLAGNETAVFENYGTITVANELRASSDFVNEGLLTVDKTANFLAAFINKENARAEFTGKGEFAAFGEVENHGELTISTSGIATFYDGFALTNAHKAKIKFDAETIFYKADVTNEGEITFNADAIVIGVNRFSNVKKGVKVVRCKIYSKDQLENVDKNSVVLRKNLAEESTGVTLEYMTTPYDKTEKKPAFLIGENKISGGNFKIEYRYDDEERKDERIIKCGVAKASVSVEETAKSEYYGKKEITYEVTRSVLVLRSGISYEYDLGYEAILLGMNYRISSYYPVTIDATQRFYTNGYTLSLDGGRGIINNGELYVNNATEGPAASNAEAGKIVLSNGTSFVNNGKTVVSGLIVVEDGDSSIENNGTITNNGNLYLNYQLSCGGNGKKYVRKALSDMAERKEIALEYSATVYDETEKKPVFKIGASGSFEDDELECLYTNNTNAGQARVTATTKNPYNEKYYGSVNAWFTIERGEKEFGTADDVSAFANVNYAKIIVTTNYYRGSVSSVTVGSNMTVDFGEYDFNGSTKFTFGEGSILAVTVNDHARFEKYLYAADVITLGGSIKNVGSFTFAPGKTNARFIKTGNNSTKFDLNGYYIEAATIIANDNAYGYTVSIVDTSAAKSGRWGKTNSDNYAITVNCGKKTNIVFNGVKVMGLKTCDSYASIVATDSNFETDYTKTLNSKGKEHLSGYYAQYAERAQFTNCAFTGYNGATVTGKGEYSFVGCEFHSKGAFTENSASLASDGNAVNVNTYAMTTGSGMLKVTFSESCKLISDHGYGINVYLREGTESRCVVTADVSTRYELSSGKIEKNEYKVS